jgi:2-polyprenyl-3-methyl-5-hydroxy-6-metoxy-1,4-benzoquinol methylase
MADWKPPLLIRDKRPGGRSRAIEFESQLMQRRFNPAEPELMDRPQPVTVELVSDLHNLRQFNRYFGSCALTTRFLRRWIQPGVQLRVLDLATGSGDIPRLVVDYARKVGATITVDASDQQESTLEIAQGLSADYPEIDFRRGDILTFGEEGAYDIVLCSLALHHFADEAAVRVLQRCQLLSRRFVLVSDLRRGWLTSMGAYLLTAFIFREPMTRNDARLSAARAFSFRELRSLAQRAGWRNLGHCRFRFGRQAIWLESQES